MIGRWLQKLQPYVPGKKMKELILVCIKEIFQKPC
jgi:hypothetical protein